LLFCTNRPARQKLKKQATHRMDIHVLVHTSKHTHYTFTCIHTHAFRHTLTHTYTHTHTRMHTHTYTHTRYTHTDTTHLSFAAGRLPACVPSPDTHKHRHHALEFCSRASASLRSVTTVGRSMSSTCWLPTSLLACIAACHAAPEEFRPTYTYNTCV